ncbi:T9SS type A sorting domain-containing protein [Crocinitomix catalasitica]|uniref:T9SS type A sorting domain-containing protein n=1 Tax=Crocinitomix catalasitica TaxID=184607 RepID=UPI00048395FC|nr:T9SS type A sorting domain-containing protein [Crocinitomix catalasitica]
MSRIIRIILIIFLANFHSTVQAQSFDELLKLIPEDRAEGDRFGYSIDIHENLAIIGAYGVDFGVANPNMGAAYIFEKTGYADWELVQKIYNSDQDNYDRFGWSVSINQNYAVIGAYAEDHNEFDAEEMGSAGSAYIFQRTEDTWVEMQKIVASDRIANAQFGWSVDIDETTVAVGANFESRDEIGDAYIYHTGAVYLFELDVDDNWIETQKIVAGDRAPDLTEPDGGDGEDLSDQFGIDVALDLPYLVVGAYHQDLDSMGVNPISNAGAAYIFEKVVDSWDQVSKLEASDRQLSDKFGWSVAIDSITVVVGAFEEDHNLTGTGYRNNSGSAYVFNRNESGYWVESQKLITPDRNSGDRFGYDVAIDDNFMVIGSFRNDSDALDEADLSDAGAAYIFEKDEGGIWSMNQKLIAMDRAIDDQLGFAVGIYSTEILLGAPQQNYNLIGEENLNDAGAAYFYSQEVCITTYTEQSFSICEGQSITVNDNIYNTSDTYFDVLHSIIGCDSIIITNLTVTPAPVYNQSIERCFGHPLYVGVNAYETTGEYTDTLTTITGCDSIVITDLFVHPENAVTQDITICWEGAYTIGGSTYTENGTYTDILTSFSFCDSVVTTNITVQLPVNNSISQSENLLIAEADDATYQWIKCDPIEIISGANERSYHAPFVGAYAVIVTEGDCSDTSSCVYVDVLSISNIEKSNFKIYPNPATDYLIIEGNNFQSYQSLSIFDATGRLIESIQPIEPKSYINTSNYSKGTYVISIEGEFGIEKSKFVKI